MNNFKVEIKKHIGVMKETNNGRKRELNIASWNDGEAKYDIRDWNETHERMSRGITFTEEEARKLLELLKTELE